MSTYVTYEQGKNKQGTGPFQTWHSDGCRHFIFYRTFSAILRSRCAPRWYPLLLVVYRSGDAYNKRTSPMITLRMPTSNLQLHTSHPWRTHPGTFSMQIESPPYVGSRYLIQKYNEYENQQIFTVEGLVWDLYHIFELRLHLHHNLNKVKTLIPKWESIFLKKIIKFVMIFKPAFKSSIILTFIPFTSSN